ncbi:hypothetical protein LTR08_009179 [Meristemomyces frigidus]|nr:hypothetical protein LTR08_009179 [Meristemomyces frigidus]
MYLQQPRGHARQRSTGTDLVTKPWAMQELQVVEPLLDGVDRDGQKDSTYKPGLKRWSDATLGCLWAISLLVVALGTYVLARRSGTHGLGGFAEGYTTDFENARSAIKLQTQQFHGSLDFKARHGFIPPDSLSMEYVGSSSAVDAAWEELTQDRYFLLSDNEARRAYGQEESSGQAPQKYWNVHHGGYVAGLDVLHTLHCLNHLRKTLYPKTYPQDPQNAVMHSAHCVDHLRQLAMCNADLTPIPTQWFDGIGQNYINSSREHTCRDFWQVRDWATERFNGSTAVRARNRDGVLLAPRLFDERAVLQHADICFAV